MYFSLLFLVPHCVLVLCQTQVITGCKLQEGSARASRSPSPAILNASIWLRLTSMQPSFFYLLHEKGPRSLTSCSPRLEQVSQYITCLKCLRLKSHNYNLMVWKKSRMLSRKQSKPNTHSQALLLAPCQILLPTFSEEATAASLAVRPNVRTLLWLSLHYAWQNPKGSRKQTSANLDADTASATAPFLTTNSSLNL